MTFTQILKLAIFMTVVSSVLSQDYCSAKLCNGRQHVGCNNSGVS